MARLEVYLSCSTCMTVIAASLILSLAKVNTNIYLKKYTTIIQMVD